MSIWFLQQNEMLTELNFKNSNNILPLPTTDEYCGTSDECYPPQDQDKLMIMLKYIRNKEYEKDQLNAYRTFNQSAVPANILPLEEICHLCCGDLSKPLSVSTNAKIMTLQGLFENYKSFVKKCIRCGHFYRYQKSCHGIHNYDDRFFLGIDVCLYLREHLLNHNSISSFVDSYNRITTQKTC